jgi:biotin synthase-like enzyme
MNYRLKAEWEIFKKIIPAGASEHQINDMQSAFYSGATVLLGLIMTGLTEGEEPKEEDLQMMDDLQTELEEFNGLLKIRAALNSAASGRRI